MVEDCDDCFENEEGDRVVEIEEAEVEKKEEAEPKPEKKKVKKESLDSDLAEIDTQAGIVQISTKWYFHLVIMDFKFIQES